MEEMRGGSLAGRQLDGSLSFLPLCCLLTEHV